MSKSIMKKTICLTTAVVLLICSYIIGGYSQITSEATVVGSLNSDTGKWQAFDGDNGATITIGLTGRYKINIVGGATAGGYGRADQKISYGGNLTGVISLKKGDVIKYVELAGGPSSTDSTQALAATSSGKYGGGKASMVYINGTPIIGAGGAGGVIITYSPSFYVDLHEGVTAINNSKFSSGSGGTSPAYESYSRGNTIPGCEPAGIGSTWAGYSGYNYLASGIIDLVEQTNNGIVPSCTISYIKVGAEDNPANIQRIADATALMANELPGLKQANQSIANSMQSIQSVISGGAIGGSSITPDTITVVSKMAFYEYVKGNDKTKGGTVDGITVINNDLTDGYVKVSGKFNTPGQYEVVIDSIKYVFKVVEQPDSTTVKAILY
ncbi:hypothetical protein Ami103574_10865 [Aminipila butyrica]|uniref:Uncharacterized protein n=1 Tax=Aminipila butyrica TaxID=433296 RepID=A0A858BY03_9FIRM|nr:hypothetical protein [Aminipila butyrica]QIB69790.1 hypothetical protein Ami103574_10865 [Aminipila butyrica]